MHRQVLSAAPAGSGAPLPGRAAELAQACAALRPAAPPALLLVAGADGMGKSAFLHRLAEVWRAGGCDAAAGPTALLDLGGALYHTSPSYVAAAADLWSRLELGPPAELERLIEMPDPAVAQQLFEKVDRALQPAVAQQAAAVQARPAAPADTFSVQTGAVGEGAVVAVGKFINVLQLRLEVARGQGNPELVGPLIRARLTAAVQERLAALPAGRPALLLLDGWGSQVGERGVLSDAAGWLAESVLGFLAGGGAPGCAAALACASDPALGPLARTVRRLELGPLPDAAVRDYFAAAITPPPPPAALDQLVEIAQGVPLAMELLAAGAATGVPAAGGVAADSRAAAPDAVIRRALEGLLAALPQETRAVVRAAAVVHQPDEALLAALGIDAAGAAGLAASGLVRAGSRGPGAIYAYHPAVRRLLLADWDGKQREELGRLNALALKHFEGLIAQTPAGSTPAFRDVRERSYHALIDDEPKAMADLTARFEELCDSYALDQAQALVEQVEEVNRRGRLSPAGQLWLSYYRARLDFLAARADRGEAAFAALAAQEGDRLLQALARWGLGLLCVQQQRWTKGVQHYRAADKILAALDWPAYAVRVRLALGAAYRSLAAASGDLPQLRPERSGASRAFYIVEHLPFLIYEWLVRRVAWLPNWYFGVNYQNWIVAYLLMEAAGWYRRAVKTHVKAGGGPLFAAELALAEIDQRLQRRARAAAGYSRLLERYPAGQEQHTYRRALVLLGRSRVLLDQDEAEQAALAAEEAGKSFARVHDTAALGAAHELQGRAWAAQAQGERAVAAFAQAAEVYRAAGDDFAATRVAAQAAALLEQGLLPDAAAAAQALLARIDRRHYIVRFPDRLLRFFRRLAVAAATPLTYLLTLVLVLALTNAFILIEGEIGLLTLYGGSIATTARDYAILAAAATLPVVAALWLFRGVYTLMGVAVVYLLGRRLGPLEREQPRLLICDEQGLACEDPQSGSRQSIAWGDAAGLHTLHYALRRTPLELISGAALLARSGESILVEGVTLGYFRLLADIQARLAARPGAGASAVRHDFNFFSLRWLALAGLLAALLVGYIAATVDLISMVEVLGPGDVAQRVEIGAAPAAAAAGPVVQAPLSLLFALLSITWLLFAALLTLLRLLAHLVAVGRVYRRPRSVAPPWLVGLAAAIVAALTVLWAAAWVAL